MHSETKHSAIDVHFIWDLVQKCDALTVILNNYYLIKRYGINFFYHKIFL